MKVEIIKYLLPTNEGDIECVLVTKKGFSELEKTLKDYEKRIEKLEKDVGEKSNIIDNLNIEIAFLKEQGLTAKEIATRYYKTRNTKNGFSTKQIFEHFGGSGNPSEIKMATYIHEKINA